MWRQWKSMSVQADQMKGQISEMAAQSGILQESVKVSRDSAKAAQDGASAAQKSADATKDSVEMFINKERARLRIEMKPLLLSPQYGSAHTVDFTVSIYGPTAAFIVKTLCVTYVLPLEHIEYREAGEVVMFPIYSLPQVIPANTTPQDCFAFLFMEGKEQGVFVPEIQAGKLFIGVRGVIKYRDVFDRDRETSFRYVWKYPSADEIGEGNWEKCGAKEENQET